MSLRSLGDSNPCFRREWRAAHMAQRRLATALETSEAMSRIPRARVCDDPEKRFYRQ
jgi:hypothetical protein